jgi:dienelactone hydrolase
MLLSAATVMLGGAGSGTQPAAASSSGGASPHVPGTPGHAPGAAHRVRSARRSRGDQGPFAVGKIVVRFVDTRRLVRFPKRRPQPRVLMTVIRYPVAADPSRVDAYAARPARSAGPFPLIVFGHGFDSSPDVYARLLQAWARAGYVVAAPIFPLSNADAPGGADESDIVNQPADMSFVISRVLAASRAEHGFLSQLVDPDEVAVAGQSDGAATALATAYDSRYLDPRVGAAVILSGAEIMPGPYFVGRDPPLLATQGTADEVNRPKYTYQFFRAAHSPKFLLTLVGARHLGPYTGEQPQLSVVERVSIAFLNRYLKRLPDARSELWRAGEPPPVARLTNGR